MQRNYRHALLLTPLMVLALIGACSDDTTTNPPAYVGDKTHGEYLLKTVVGCDGCHTPRLNTGAPDPTKFLAGGESFPLGGGDTVYSANLTPDKDHGLGNWTDEQIIAAIRTGIEGHREAGETDSVLTPIMPYYLFAYLTDEDVKDIVAYLRSVPAIANEVPENTVSNPALKVLWPKQSGIPAATPNNTQTQRGQYLVTLACSHCHTKSNAEIKVFAPGLAMNLWMAGGGHFDLGPFVGVVYVDNVTPDTTHGIGDWTPAQIRTALTEGKDDEGDPICPPMPWQSFKNMTSTDIDAIIAYLKGIPANANVVPPDTANCM